MLDKQKIVTAMNDIFDISGETHTDVLGVYQKTVFNSF